MVFDRVAIHKGLTEKLRLEDVPIVCSMLGVDHENLSGDGKIGILREIVSWAERHAKQQEISSLYQQLMENKLEKQVDGVSYNVFVPIFLGNYRVLMFSLHDHESFEPVNAAIHVGETEKQAASRAIFEETGLSVEARQVQLFQPLPDYFEVAQHSNESTPKIKAKVFPARYWRGDVNWDKEKYWSHGFIQIDTALRVNSQGTGGLELIKQASLSYQEQKG
jgi:hypothetical protein